MTKVLLLFCLSIGILFFSFSNNEKKPIEYNASKELSWDDYNGKPNRASSFKALTATRISFSANSNGKVLKLSLQNYFEPKNSWTKTKNNEILLNHERLHFHISELYARKLRKEILETEFKLSGKKLMNEISQIYSQKMKELSLAQQRYDRETDHSIKEKEQTAWQSNIKTELFSLKNFAEPDIEIDLK